MVEIHFTRHLVHKNTDCGFLKSPLKSSFLDAKMKSLKKKYIVNERNEKIAVQLYIKIFEKIQNILEDTYLASLIAENKLSDRLSLKEAKSVYFLNHKVAKTLRNTK